MPFRNPLMLDFDLLQSIADQVGVDMPTSTDITRRTRGETAGTGGIRAHVVEVGGSKSKEEEVTESYRTEAPNPVAAMNQIIDHLVQDDRIGDLSGDPNAAVTRHDLIELEATLNLSPAVSIGQLMSRVMPMMLAAAAAGGDAGDLDNAELMTALLATETLEELPSIAFEAEPTETSERQFLVLADPGNLVRRYKVEDLQDDLTVFGVVHRLVPAGKTFSLRRMMAPGSNPLVQTALAQSGLNEQLMEMMTPLLGRAVDMSNIDVPGPLVVVKPVAIY